MTEDNLTPYQRLLAQKAARKQRAQRLSDYQREQRKVANTISQRRAIRVLKDRYHGEFLEIAKAERHALVEIIDKAYAAGDTRPLVEILDAQNR